MRKKNKSICILVSSPILAPCYIKEETSPRTHLKTELDVFWLCYVKTNFFHLLCFLPWGISDSGRMLKTQWDLFFIMLRVGCFFYQAHGLINAALLRIRFSRNLSAPPPPLFPHKFMGGAWEGYRSGKKGIGSIEGTDPSHAGCLQRGRSQLPF